MTLQDSLMPSSSTLSWPDKGLFTLAILCLAIDIVEYVLNRRGHQGQIAANHKQISFNVYCQWCIAYTRMTITRVNEPLDFCYFTLANARRFHTSTGELPPGKS